MFEITSGENCRYCTAAKERLDAMNLPWRENLLDAPEKKHAFIEAGFKTVPQIWHNGNHIGGYTELIKYLEQMSLPPANPVTCAL